MNDLEALFTELRPSQARRRGFESHHPLHSKLIGERLAPPKCLLSSYFTSRQE